MKIFFPLFFLCWIFSVHSLTSQVTIGTSKVPEPFSTLELDGNKGGLRLNWLTNTDQENLKIKGVDLARGLLIYNVSKDVVQYWNGTVWVDIVNREVGNGVSLTGNKIELGGDLDSKTSINTLNNSLSIQGDNSNFFNLTNTAQEPIFTVDGTNKAIAIGANKPHSSAILDLTATNKGLLLPRVALKATDVADPVVSPTIGLVVYNIADASEGSTLVQANNLYAWDGQEWSMLINQATFKNTLDYTLSNLGVPRQAVFKLRENQINFLNTMGAGARQSIPMDLLINNLPNDISFDSQTNKITFKKTGVYTMTFVYEALHSATDCNLASYLMDFPDVNGTRSPVAGSETTSTTRIHTTATFNAGANSNHGGTISYSALIAAGSVWQIQLGRGQSGNCASKPNLTLFAPNTQFVIMRTGDIR